MPLVDRISMYRWDRFFFVFYFLLSGALVLFSFTQVDLSLTLSSASVIQTVQKAFQQIGYYQRPVATSIYLTIVTFFFVGYGLMFFAGKTKRISLGSLWTVIGVLSVVMLFSYPAALSYDVFNYIFTAKTVLVYHQNPYSMTPLQLQGIDPMLSFMRWTHLASAYTPLWIGLTLPFFLLSFGSLLLALFMMKGLTILFYLLCVYFVGNVMDSIDRKQKLPAMILFAFNPLVIIEVLLGAHNDIAMMALALGAFSLAQRQQRTASFFVLSLSVATKLITAALLPLAVIPWNRWLALILMSAGLIAVLLRREFLPWYFLWVLPFATLFPDKKQIIILIWGICLGLLLTYAPVLYWGHYNSPVPELQRYGLLIPIGISLAYASITSLPKKRL